MNLGTIVESEQESIYTREDISILCVHFGVTWFPKENLNCADYEPYEPVITTLDWEHRAKIKLKTIKEFKSNVEFKGKKLKLQVNLKQANNWKL